MSGVQEFQVYKMLLYGSSNVGVFCIATDKYVFVPFDAPEKVDRIFGEILRVEVKRVQIGGSKLLGVLAVANSRGIVLPRTARDVEVEQFSKLGMEVAVLDCKYSALGNLIVANDRGAIVSPILPRDTVKTIEDVLGVEVVQCEVAGSPLVGSIIAASNKGALVTPEASADDLKLVSDVLKVPADIGTVNRGRPYVRGGMVVNSFGAVVGEETTGPEIMRIVQVFGGQTQ